MKKVESVSLIPSFLLAAIFFITFASTATATFSIVAVDTVNGVIGGAGASCIGNSKIINDIIEGVGAVHTQAYYNSQNQINAHNLLGAGHTPDSIISWLVNNDAEGELYAQYRQYGVVTLAGPGSSAGFTGSYTTSWKGHLTGPGYAIQGNILLGPQILDTMETAYLNTEGPMEERLMAAMEAANIPGADTRCIGCDKPAISAFIKVVRIGDGGTAYLYEFVDNTICEENPIDSLRIRYDLWIALRYADPEVSTVAVSPLLILADGSDSAVITVTPLNHSGEPPTMGAEVALANSGGGSLSPVTDNSNGTFTASIISPTSPGTDTITATVTAGGEIVELNDKPIITYILCGDMNGDGPVNMLDILHIISYLYKGGPEPALPSAADVNSDQSTDMLDILYLITYLYKGGPDPDCP
jgi:uncharacterized Ntn-hydrolase superfamily protein